MEENNSFKKGIIAGIPICFGYFAVSFAFGIYSVSKGLSVIESLLISMTNVTSAGQLAAVPIIATGGTMLEIAASQIIINLRYALMSLSLSQKVSDNVKIKDRLIISFINTDEVFAVASSVKGNVGKRYLYGLILTPYIGWSTGTFIGAAAGNILPEAIVSALGIAIYAMFIAIVIPPAKKNGYTAMCIIFSVLLSCIFYYLPALRDIPSGFAVIICAVASSSIFALLSPIDEKEAN